MLYAKRKRCYANLEAPLKRRDLLLPWGQPCCRRRCKRPKRLKGHRRQKGCCGRMGGGLDEIRGNDRLIRVLRCTKSLKGSCRVDYKSSPTKLERLFCLWVYKCIPANGGGNNVFGLRFCNPRTGEATMFLGYVFVTREREGRCCGRAVISGRLPRCGVPRNDGLRLSRCCAPRNDG